MPARFCRSGFCMLALAFASLHAEEMPLGPQDLLNALMQNNPEIQAARSRFETATKRPSQAGTLPEPTASYTNLGVGHPFSRLNASEFSYQGLASRKSSHFPESSRLRRRRRSAKQKSSSRTTARLSSM